ncbi:LarC family nickel insertion protein [Radiobacillus sp. PE A8.2]|uniref:LarC family nickel insertion protein n=1 Tax=Radiobacillus sp. PE A8.2 TaxID=3380349 RepID=UPI00388ECF7D
MKVLYFDCFSGISGDMTIGALLDAGANADALVAELKKLNFEDEYELSWTKVNKNGITSTKFDVHLLNEEHTHAHHHAHTHDHKHHHEHSHTHTHHHTHDHEHHHHEHNHAHEHADHQHHGEGHAHHHRSYKDIVKMITEAGLSENAENIALRIFKKIGEAEGHIHGMPLETVHFHEVGAVDSIIDIVGTSILIDQLGIDKIIASPVPVGSGHIHIDHGIYPVPAPATLEILRGVPLRCSSIKAELTTPTGAAIIAVLAEEYGDLPAITVNSIGYGAGTKTFPDHPNVLRAVIGEQK